MYISFFFVEMQVKLFITLKTVTVECKKLSAEWIATGTIIFCERETIIHVLVY